MITPEIERAMALLEGGDSFVLTGRAGTGKSTLIRDFLAATGRNVVVAAPTGIAALNVGGYTLHRLFGFRPETSIADVRSGRYYPGRFADAVRAMDTLVIDEASMVRADLFDQIEAALSRFGPQRGEPFGGVQLVLVGDLHQLPPVVTEAERPHLEARYPTPYFFSAECYRGEDFPTVELTTVFRQLGDDRLTSILNSIREGVLLGATKTDLDSRADPGFEPPEHELWLTLATTNRIVTARNRERLARIDAPELVHLAEEWGELAGFDPPTPRELRFKVGAQIMMIANDPGDRWVNGSLGTVLGIGEDPSEVRVALENGAAVVVRPTTWDVTRPTVVGGSLEHEVVGAYTQLPFTLAWAITIHKSQGQTLDRMVVDLTGGTFDVGQLYVALSRGRSLDGLVLRRPVFPRDMKIDRRVVRFLAESGTAHGERRFCAIGMLTVGDEGRRSRPRPVELAVAFDDGTAITTLVNPQRDLADARSAYGVTVDDVLLAPTLADAWGLISPMLAGCTAVGPGVDHDLGLIDFELKRLGHAIGMPLGVEVRGRVTGATALERARSALGAHARAGSPAEGGTPFGVPVAEGPTAGCLLSRDVTTPPATEAMPALSAFLDISSGLGPVLLGHVDAVAGERVDGWSGAARAAAAAQLRVAAGQVHLTPTVRERLRAAERVLEVSVLDEASDAVEHDLEQLLVPGARVCFTGVAELDGRLIDRDEAQRIAARAGLVPVANVSKTRCDVLVVAELGTQSGKARKAADYGKPVVSAADFFAWAAGPTGPAGR